MKNLFFCLLLFAFVLVTTEGSASSDPTSVEETVISDFDFTVDFGGDSEVYVLTRVKKEASLVFGIVFEGSSFWTDYPESSTSPGKGLVVLAANRGDPLSDTGKGFV